MIEEIWKGIPGYEELYQASSLGNIKSLKNNIILKPGISKGYAHVSLYKDKLRETCRVHQVIALTFFNHKSDRVNNVINHIDFDPLNNSLSNLEIMSQRENANHKHLKSSSKHTGVYRNNKDKRWMSAIYYNGKCIYLGTFIEELEAKKYYDDAVKAVKNGTEIQVKRIKKKRKIKLNTDETKTNKT